MKIFIIRDKLIRVIHNQNADIRVHRGSGELDFNVEKLFIII